jgi:ribosome-associated toxin RatA of RatAB toxin-antitoxin module
VCRAQGKDKLCWINLSEGLFETAEDKWEIISQEACSVSRQTFLPFTLHFVASDFVLNLKSGVEFEAVFVALTKTENGVPCCAKRSYLKTTLLTLIP